MQRSAIAILTYRRQNVLATMLSGLQQHCGHYRTAVFEDCGQRDGTADLLQAGRTPKPRRDLMAVEFEAKDINHPQLNYRNLEVFMGTRNLGVAANSNRAIRWFMEETKADHLCLCNDDLHVDGDFVKLYARGHADLGTELFCFGDFTHHPSYKWTTYRVRGYGVKFMGRMTGIMMSMTRSLVDKIGYFDAAFGQFGQEHPLAPETQIWMGDYSFKRIDEIKLGDVVIGWSRSAEGGVQDDTLCRSRVIGIRGFETDVVDAVFESGRVVRCSPKHNWLLHPQNGVHENGRYAGYAPLEVNRTYVRVLDVSAQPLVTAAYEHGYVHGLIDGGGSWDTRIQHTSSTAVMERLHAILTKFKISYTLLPKYRVQTASGTAWLEAPSEPDAKLHFWTQMPDLTPNYQDSDDFWQGWLGGVYDASGSGRCICQNPGRQPQTTARLKAALERFGFKCREQAADACIHGGRLEMARFAALTRPTVTAQLDEAILVDRFQQEDRVVALWSAGRSKVYCIQTTTGNFVADGYASHNCDFNIRARMAGGVRLESQDMNCLDLEHTLLRHQECPTSVTGPDRLRADREADEIMRQASESYRWRHTYRPFLLAKPRKAGGYNGGGIDVDNLLTAGYRLITDLSS